MASRAFLTASIATALIGSAPAAATAAIPRHLPDRVIGDCVHAQIKPKLIIIACADAGIVATNLKYQHYGPENATGRGTLTFNNCSPDCAEGHFSNTPITFSLDKIKLYGGHPVFTRLRITYLRGPRLTGKPTDTFTLYLPPLHRIGLKS